MNRLLALALLVATPALAIETPAEFHAKLKQFCAKEPKEHQKQCLEQARAEARIYTAKYRERKAAERKR